MLHLGGVLSWVVRRSAVVAAPTSSSAKALLCSIRGGAHWASQPQHHQPYHRRRTLGREEAYEDEGGDTPWGDQKVFAEQEEVARERQVVRNVYQESEATRARSDEEVQAFYQQHAITVVGSTPRPVLSLAELDLPESLKHDFEKRRIETPTPIQSMAWPLAMSGNDMIGIAQTGSGKTLGYLVPAAMHVLAQPPTDLRGPTALVLAPTRELVQQIQTVAQQWLRYPLGLHSIGVYGGANRMPQVEAMRRGAQVCVATPGRLLDLLSSRQASLANSSVLVLDEADRMLDMGFEPQIRDIIGQMRQDRQTVMFSATWPKEVRQLAADFMQPDAVRVNIGSTELCANRDIRQEVRVVDEYDKKNLLLNLVNSRPDDKILVFAATKRSVTALARELIRSGVRCVESHGDLSQAKRERALQLFQGRANVMVATDVAARGLDVRNIALVVNMDFPQTTEDYVHRIGRTGRSGCKGEAITFFTEANRGHARSLINILRQAGQEVPAELDQLVSARRGGGHYNDDDEDDFGHGRNFRQPYGQQKNKQFSRFSRSSNWKNAARYN